MTPLSDLIAAIVARVIAPRGVLNDIDQLTHEVDQLSVMEAPRDRDSIDAWAEPEAGE